MKPKANPKDPSAGNVIIGLAIILPVVFYLVFKAFRLGVQIAFVPSVQLNVQSLLSSVVNSTFVQGGSGATSSSSPPDGFNGGFSPFLPGIQQNVTQLINGAHTGLGVSSYDYSVVVSAWVFDCGLAVETPSLSSANPYIAAQGNSSVPAIGNPTRQPSENTVYVQQGATCAAAFNDSNTRLALCPSSRTKTVCYELSVWVQNPAPSIVNIDNFMFRTVMDDNRCMQSKSMGSSAIVVGAGPTTTLPTTTSSSTTSTTDPACAGTSCPSGYECSPLDGLCYPATTTTTS